MSKPLNPVSEEFVSALHKCVEVANQVIETNDEYTEIDEIFTQIQTANAKRAKTIMITGGVLGAILLMFGMLLGLEILTIIAMIIAMPMLIIPQFALYISIFKNPVRQRMEHLEKQLTRAIKETWTPNKNVVEKMAKTMQIDEYRDLYYSILKLDPFMRSRKNISLKKTGETLKEMAVGTLKIASVVGIVATVASVGTISSAGRKFGE